MRISDLINLSVDNLKRRKSRTFLTVLGVVIGTCSIIMMISIGIALEKSFDDMLQGMGDLTLIEVYNWNNEETEPLTDEMIESFSEINNVKLTITI